MDGPNLTQAVGPGAPTGYTASTTAYASASFDIGTSTATSQSASLYFGGTPRLLPYIAATYASTPYQYVLQLTMGTLTGGTYTKQGKFRLRATGIAGNI